LPVNKKTSFIILDISVEAVNFIVLDYLLSSALLSFRASILYVLFFAVKVWLITKFWEVLRRTLPNKMAAGCVAGVSLMAVAIIIAVFGYLPIATIPIMLL
jgi:hypothetical protein